MKVWVDYYMITGISQSHDRNVMFPPRKKVHMSLISPKNDHDW